MGVVFVGQAAFFAIAAVVVVLWLPLIVFFESVDTWQLVINTATSVLAFLLIALLQNSENRNDRAQHAKLDAIAAALADHMEQDISADDRALRRRITALRGAIGIEEQV